MKSRKIKSTDICIMAVFVASGLVLQYIENYIAITSVPGGKIGLANIVSILNIFMFGGGNALLISTIRAFLGALLSGGISAIPYSVSGAVFSTIAMWICKKLFYPDVSMIGIGVLGAVFHNLAQICVAAVIFSSPYVFSYMPFLILFALVSGAITGYTAQLFERRFLQKYRRSI